MAFGSVQPASATALASTTTTVTASPDYLMFGGTVTLTATVSSGSGVPTGTVTFTDGATPLGTVPLTNGTATTLVSLSILGLHTITATYSGDSSFSSSSNTDNVTVDFFMDPCMMNPTLCMPPDPCLMNPTLCVPQQASTTTTVTATPNSLLFGGTVTLTATVSSGSGMPTGTVTFTDGATPLGTVPLLNGIATSTAAVSTIGVHTITATYSGDSSFSGSSNTVNVTVDIIMDPCMMNPTLCMPDPCLMNPTLCAPQQVSTTTVVTAAPNPLDAGSPVTLTATVSGGSGAPTGTVSFADGAAPLGTATLVGGTATLTTSALRAGAHTITAAYSGDISFAGSTGTVGVLVKLDLMLGDQQGNAGTDISLPLTLSSNDGTIAAMELDLSFDPQVVTFKGVTMKDGLTLTADANMVSAGSYRIVIGDANVTAIPLGVQEIGTAVFTIGAGQAYGTTSTVNLTNIIISDTHGHEGSLANDSATITVVDTIAPTVALTPSTTELTTALAVNAASDGTGSNIVMKKWMPGNVALDTVKDEGMVFASDSFELTSYDMFKMENDTLTVYDTFTVYVEDEAGNGSIQTIAVDNVVLKGDADLDWDVDLLDWTKTAAFILKKETPNGRQTFAADMNNTGTVNVGDWVSIANEILNVKDN
jgi:hypothetical protein